MSLAAYIREDLKQRIQSQQKLPCKLTLPGLATHYQVSITPVRTAVAKLIAEGVVRKQSNGRLDVIPRRSPTGGVTAKAIGPPKTAADWDQTLVEEVMVASLERDAVHLREEALAQKYDIGRSVIRQSLSRLAGAGLIEHVPRRGWRVHPIQGEDLCAYLEIREALELKALELAKPHLVRQDLDQMLEGNPPTPGHELPRLDNRLHKYLIEKSGNRYIQNFFGQYTAAYYTAVLDRAAPEAHVVAEMAAQHRQILKALVAKHWARARRALSEHIQAQHPIAMKMVDVLLEEARD
ncbi:DNA-binding transcriptional regulator CsiR [Planctomycetes bacterium CA13]|uniref:DNA-binding transcriptional regulator CsiR n=1 Tax=Novipirellula herctigrandis TaxID=2527986 RepID=A0A5C5YX60_9BACT|nr:DNA-binding transcriptional regulator CsiR [Planctomycetes bacterium CA13]